MSRHPGLVRRRFLCLALWAGILSCAGGGSAATKATTDGPGTVWLLAPDTPPGSGKFAGALRHALEALGVPVQEAGAGQWDSLLADPCGPGEIVLVMPGAALPPDGRARLERFLKQGNHLLSLSGPAFSGLQEPPTLETLSPAYKTYPTRTDRLRLPDGMTTFPAERMVIAPLPRPRGLGSDQVRPARFIPMAEALDQEGHYRGAAAHLYLNTKTAYAGAVWGGLGLAPAEIEEILPESVHLVLGMVERLRRGLFLADAGAEHFAYAAGETVTCGADLVNLGAEPQIVQVSIAVIHEGRKVHEQSERVTVPARSVAKPWHVGTRALDLTPGQYQVKVSVHLGDLLVDELSGPVQVVEYATVPPREVVVVGGGEFLLAGRPWHPLGMNYWPHLAAGLEPREFSRNWLSPEQYDPEVVERDLTLAEQLGLNVLSIQYSDLEQARSLMDFMARAARHRLKVNIYSPVLEPLRPDLARARRMILGAHLPDSPAFFAYDVCWEGHLGTYASRCASDAQWQAWVIERYGSISSAEDDWHYHPPRVAGAITGPSDDQLMHDGDWRVFVAAYRRFCDDEISRSYRTVREAIRDMDPVHLIGARSGYGGNGTPMYANLMPFDLAAGARYLDFISPEGYALAGEWKDFLKGGLTTAYARLVSGGKPVFWAEFGVPVRWEVEPPQYRPVEKAEELEPQRAYFKNMLRFVRETGANGCSGWWWPGGYRVDEKSDFGVVNPDGTFRPAALELGQSAPDYAAPWTHPPSGRFLMVDRDQYVNGFAGLYTARADEYVQAFLDGRTPGVRTDGTGTTSASTPPLAVGNVPWNGNNPPKFLNAEFTRVELRVRDGWRRIENGEQVEVPAGKAWFRVCVANTAEAQWLVPDPSLGAGGVSLVVDDDHGGRALHPLPTPVPFLGEALFPEFGVDVDSGRPAEVALRLWAEKRTAFGERFRVRLTPGPQSPRLQTP